MKIVFHIGMGKTGTSSIQAALSQNTQELQSQGALYLGMWFDRLDSSYKGLQNQQNFFALSPEEMRVAAEKLHDLLKARAESEGLSTFIFSNETFSGKARALDPLIKRLEELGADCKAICYVRNPASWLPSAYVQWGIRHKHNTGPIQPYPVKARRLVGWYAEILEWHACIGDKLELRSYEKSPDVVEDLGRALGLRLTPLHSRVLERADPAEVLLRAMFNDRIEKSVLPDAFDKAMFPSLTAIPRVEDVLSGCYDYSETEAIVAEKSALFDRVAAVCGFDPREMGTPKVKEPNTTEVRERLLDVLVDLVLTQSRRIQRLDNAVTRLTKALEENGKG